jgi:hypothetical protein
VGTSCGGKEKGTGTERGEKETKKEVVKAAREEVDFIP